MRAFASGVKRFVPIAACLILGLSRLSAATLVQLSLSDMIGQSTAIEHAKVVTSWAAFSGPVIYTHYQLQVSERWKGSAITEIVVYGGVANGIRQAYAGAPQLNPGDDYVFFLQQSRSDPRHRAYPGPVRGGSGWERGPWGDARGEFRTHARRDDRATGA
jgi:hypothetical protein